MILKIIFAIVVTSAAVILLVALLNFTSYDDFKKHPNNDKR